MTSIDTIFFDVDGTLVDARKDIVNAVNHVLGAFGLEEKPFGLIVSYVGTGVKDLIRKSLGEDRAGSVEEGVRIFSGYYVRHPADEAELYPHVKETLEYFRAKRKLILTNRYAVFADATLKGLGIRHYFEDVIGGDDEGCLKPSVCVLDKVFPRLNIDKEKSMIVGDMAIDVMMGKNAGLKTCWVSYGLGGPEEARALGPDYIIDDMAELKSIIR